LIFWFVRVLFISPEIFITIAFSDHHYFSHFMSITFSRLCDEIRRYLKIILKNFPINFFEYFLIFRFVRVFFTSSEIFITIVLSNHHYFSHFVSNTFSRFCAEIRRFLKIILKNFPINFFEYFFIFRFVRVFFTSSEIFITIVLSDHHYFSHFVSNTFSRFCAKIGRFLKIILKNFPINFFDFLIR